MTITQVAPLHGTHFLFHLPRVTSGLTKEAFPTALEGLLADANTLEVSVANHECHDKEHEHVDCVPRVMVGNYSVGARARWRCHINTDVCVFVLQECMHSLAFAPT